MQNQNSDEILNINPAHQTQILTQGNSQQTQANYVNYVEEYPNQHQQTLSTYFNQLVQQSQPIIDQVPEIENLNLIQYSSKLVQKRFCVVVTLVNWIQEMIMIITSYCTWSQYYGNQHLEGNYSPYYLYIILAVTLFCIIGSKKLQLPKNYALQILVQVIMTYLYMLVAAGITYFTYSYGKYFLFIIIFHFLAYSWILICLLSQNHAQNLTKKFSMLCLQITITIVIVFILLIAFFGSIWAELLILIVIISGLVTFVWTVAFGMIYITGLQMLLAGIGKVEKTACISSATIVFGNMIIPS